MDNRAAIIIVNHVVVDVQIAIKFYLCVFIHLKVGRETKNINKVLQQPPESMETKQEDASNESHATQAKEVSILIRQCGHVDEVHSKDAT